MPRQGLQISLVILGLVPTITGSLGMFGLDDPLYASLGLPRNALLDSNLRFYSGVWFVLGITVLLTVQSLEKYFELYKILWAMIFVVALDDFYPLPLSVYRQSHSLGLLCLRYWGHRYSYIGIAKLQK